MKTVKREIQSLKPHTLTEDPRKPAQGYGAARYVVFCTARPEKVRAAVKTAFPGAKAEEILYVGPDGSPMSNDGSVEYLSWGGGYFSFSAGRRIWGALRGLNPSGVMLPLNNNEGYGYGALRIYCWLLAPGCATEVTADGEMRPLSSGFSKLAGLKTEEVFHQSLIGTMRLLTPLFIRTLHPLPDKATARPPATGPAYKTVRDVSTNGKQPDVTVVIRSYNEAALIGRALKAVTEQRGINKEIVVIDSQSSDATVEIAARYPARIYEVEKKNFSYGASLNLGATLARGGIVVNLSAHAIPADDEWILKLIEPLKEPSIGGVHGGELPLDERCGLFERKILTDAYGTQPEIKTDDPVFSNANSAMPKELVAQVPFDETLDWAEDQLWAHDIQKLGYKTAYVAGAAVYHSHGLTMKENFDRCLKYHRMLFSTIYRDTAGEVRNKYRDNLTGRSISFARFLSEKRHMNKMAANLYAPYCEFINYLGCELAWREHRADNGIIS